jgi:phosphoadenosine phosphosulfate reductase
MTETASPPLGRTLHDLAAAGRRLFDESSAPGDVLAWAAREVGLERLAVATSFEDAVMSHIASESVPGVTVLFVDTGYHFAETLGLRDAVSQVCDVQVRTLAPPRTVPEQDAYLGRDLFARNPDMCCRLRKVAPLDAALAGFDAWASGLRRDDHSGRADVEIVSVDERRGMLKLNPLAHWEARQVEEYAAAHRLLANPLRQSGYRSIGCSPCTRPVASGESDRAGRWTGFAKDECGIHS